MPEKQLLVTFQFSALYCHQRIRGQGMGRSCLFRLLGGGFYLIDEGGEKSVAVALGRAITAAFMISSGATVVFQI